MLLQDALAIERTQASELVQALPRDAAALARAGQGRRVRRLRVGRDARSAVVAADEHAAVVPAEPDRVRHRDAEVASSRAPSVT